MPFGPYADFEECVLDNQDKDDPEAFCAWLHEQIVGEPPSAGASKSGSVRVPLEVVREACPGCADKMEDLGLKALVVGKQMPAELLDGLCGMFSDPGFFTECSQHDFEGQISDVEAFCAWLHFECTGAWPSEQSMSMKGTLTGPIVRKDAKRQIAYAAVLVPGEPDSDNDVLTAQKIEEVAHRWMEEFRNIDIQHTLNNVDAIPVESYLSPQSMSVTVDGQVLTIPKGSWILASKVRDPSIWKGIEEGQYRGYSVMGVRRATLKAAAEKGDTVAFKRTTLADLGEDWVAPFVSIVDEPAVPKAKFFALKAKEKQEESGTIRQVIKSVFGRGNGHESADKVGMRFSASTLSTLRDAVTALEKLLEEAEEERERKKREKRGRVASKDVEDEALRAVKEALK